MNKRLMNSLVAVISLCSLIVTRVYAATPPQTLTLASPIQSSLSTGGTQQITYVLANNMSSVQNMVSPPSITNTNYDTVSLDNECPMSMAPNSTCTIIVNVTAGNAPASASQTTHTLTAIFGSSKGNTPVSTSFGYTITVPAPAQPSLTVTGPSPAIPTLTVGQVATTYTHKISNDASAGPAYIDVNNIKAITDPSDLSDEVTYTSSDCPSAPIALAAGASCTATITIKPTQPVRSATVQLSVPYGATVNSDDDTAVSPITADSTFTINPGPSLLITGPSPTVSNMTVGGGAAIYTYTISNAVDSGPAYINLTKIGPSTTANLVGQVKYDTANTTCTQATSDPNVVELDPGKSCTASLIVTPTNAATNAQLSLQVFFGPTQSQSLLLVTYSSPPSTFEIAANPNMRTITFKNNCPTTNVWFGISPDASTKSHDPDASASNPSLCRADNDCYAGQSCLAVSPTVKQCFWNTPTISNYELTPGQSTTISLPALYQQVMLNNQVWGATIVGRTGCTSGSCQTGDCSNNGAVDATGACVPGAGFKGPVTSAKLALFTGYQDGQMLQDSYSISLTNGATIPMSIGPSNVDNANNPNTTSYTCGVAGSGSISKNAGACSWTFTPSAIPDSPVSNSNDYFNYVADGGAPCSGTCPQGQVCGLSVASIAALTQPNATPALTCGKPLGYWTGNQVCSYPLKNGASVGAPFNCTTNAGSYQSITYGNLYACQTSNPSFLQSCYNGGGDNSCCGCENWGTDANLPVTGVKSCASSNPTWINSVLPTVYWLKNGCPSAQVYPEDITATFACGNNQQISGNGTFISVNMADYIVTFCPTGAAGNANF